MTTNPQQNDSQEPLSLEANFTLHVLSLFGTLFDNKAAPYIGVIPPDDIQPKVDEEEDGEGYYEPPPPFETSLCDFRLRALYKTELDSRQALIDDLVARGENINENSTKAEAEKIVLGDRLVPRNEKGTSTEVEFKKKREEFLDKRAKLQVERRSKLLTQRKNRIKETARSEREESKLLREEYNRIKEAEERQRKKEAAHRREKMEQRRQIQMQKREKEMRKTEDAQRTIENLSYRSKLAPEAIAKYDFRNQERLRQKDLNNSVRRRKLASETISEQNRQTIKPKPHHDPFLIST